jgi:NAD(P)-dependent dehydrogenase (short-subunit alcohol dehydrogenase family)
MYDFSGKNALVSGGTTGIGLAIARAFAAAGAKVIAAGLPGVTETRDVDACELDVTADDNVRTLLTALDSLDFLVNCAGIIRRDEEYEIGTFLRVLDVNLAGTMRMCAAAKPLLAARQGAIVNSASMLTYFGGPRVPAYSASKGGVASLTRSLAVAWAGDGVRVNAVAPGWITTPLTQALFSDAGRSAPILARTPMARWGKPEEVAGAVLFLCSPDAAFITGAILPVDGGYSAA